ncbi:hypothetical protein (plasmid) [Lactobacillus plantarum] [Lactiplantibacillus mudanjiangensis]|uniref:SAP domain-containing protein n=1 Tax=Lactiplantibacillus mudanjiangensis TaxID=1296538 RepID=UPI00101565BD|nr:SAP domain-containing protein [Lactiplantibacillus mudanjiangensis]VDG30793.1 hypothetical protein (plasmid) [Lactobacillus plantarum] [Lactiplantibacillus mudanjiangensis]
MATRPPFDLKMTRTTFQRFYWYKTELQQLCRQYQLPTTGTKAELTQYLGQLLDGQAATQIKPIRPVHRTAKASLTADQITVETKLLASGFKLNQAARTFFASYFGVEKFVFRKAMGVKMRAVERDHDTTATVADLIAALADPTVIEPTTEQTYQWNNFVKDFYRDSAVSYGIN